MFLDEIFGVSICAEYIVENYETRRIVVIEHLVVSIMKKSASVHRNKPGDIHREIVPAVSEASVALLHDHPNDHDQQVRADQQRPGKRAHSKHQNLNGMRV